MRSYPLSFQPVGSRAISVRRGLLLLATLTAATVLFGACGGGSNDAGENGEQVQLVYQDWRSEWFPPMAQAMLDEFHATHPNIHVFYSPDPEHVEETMLAEMQAGTAADVFQGCCTFFPI